jgi:hypothetical protein
LFRIGQVVRTAAVATAMVLGPAGGGRLLHVATCHTPHSPQSDAPGQANHVGQARANSDGNAEGRAHAAWHRHAVAHLIDDCPVCQALAMLKVPPPPPVDAVWEPHAAPPCLTSTFRRPISADPPHRAQPRAPPLA